MDAQYLFLATICFVEAIAITELYRKLKANQLEVQLKLSEKTDLQDRLVDKVKEKIEMTCRSRKARFNKDDLFASYIYKQDKVSALGEEMQSIFHNEIALLRSKYPQLTDLDLLVLSLLAIGMDNDEICELTQMEKRTLYRRRQLIAQRIDLSSTQLEAFAAKIFNMEEI